LVGDGDHPHPAPEDPQLIDGVETLRAATHLHHRQRFALRGTNAAKRERDPVNLRFHHAGHCAMAFWRDPHHALCPLCQIAQFHHLGMGRAVLIGQWQAGGVVKPCLSPEMRQNPR
jgi:hypothetical protein